MECFRWAEVYSYQTKRLDIGADIFERIMFSDECIHILLIAMFLLWLTFCFGLIDRKSYGVSFFCCLAQMIALIGYEGIHINLALKKFGADTSTLIPSIIIITNWIVCVGVFITSVVAINLHGRKQDKITMCLSLLHGLCYFWIFIIYQAWASC